jgi:hypothetical protein
MIDRMKGRVCLVDLAEARGNRCAACRRHFRGASAWAGGACSDECDVLRAAALALGGATACAAALALGGATKGRDRARAPLLGAGRSRR